VGPGPFIKAASPQSLQEEKEGKEKAGLSHDLVARSFVKLCRRQERVGERAGLQLQAALSRHVSHRQLQMLGGQLSYSCCQELGAAPRLR